jgi:hypothetical protein
VSEKLAPLTATSPANTDPTETTDSPSSDDDVENAGETGPVEVEGATVNGQAVPVDSEADGGVEVTTDAGTEAADASAPVMTLTKSQSCTSKYAAHTSTAKLTWTVTGTKVAITALTVQVHNSDGRDKNDVDVYETQPASSEVKQFNSGDVLVSDKNIIVGFNGNKAPKLGTKVRFSTNFDQSGSDPSASCSVTVQ